MEKNLKKLYVVLIIVGIAALAYFLYREVNKSADQKKEEERKQQMKRFERELQKWIDNIYTAKTSDKPTPGWEDWWIQNETIRKKLTKSHPDVRGGAYYMIKLQDRFVPDGYYVDKINGEWGLFEGEE